MAGIAGDCGGRVHLCFHPFKSAFICVLLNPGSAWSPKIKWRLLVAQEKPRPLPSPDRKTPAGTAVNPSPVEKIVPERPDPTRYRDWEKNGRCIDFRSGMSPEKEAGRTASFI
ncbi:succinate dehydrogenase assembly factor 4 [Telmatospirillum siberiense]|uniref:DUF1674 domain-containing protein n=1 Tax=Telmatospirillum siberiense TaxID=382514 RepID=A0A2N3PSZ2_9PROT|nr:succinate dehydrogenase assembly factor 4 [Telmatospirillum siberiense]PKU23525.1 hypothetical protein CWS72_15755 [Telmatospirillum siberiense]